MDPRNPNLADLNSFLDAMWVEDHAIRNQAYENPQQSPMDTLQFLLSLGPNLMASAIDEGYEFDDERTYATYLVEKGVPWGLAGVLGTALDLIEPGPGEFMQAAKVGGAALAGLGPMLKRLPQYEDGLSLFRMQDPATGLGPFQDTPSTMVARGNLSGNPAQYHSGSPDYLRGYLDEMRFGQLGDLEVMQRTPRIGSTSLDVIDPGPDDYAMLQRMHENLMANDLVPPHIKRLLEREYQDMAAGYAQPFEYARSVELGLGFDWAGSPHATGIQRLAQYPDDNLSAVHMNRMGRLGEFDRAGAEHVVFDPNSLYTHRTWSGDEFYDLVRSGQGISPVPYGAELIRGADSANLINTARSGDGFTFDPRTGAARPGAGYAFSPNPQLETAVPMGQLSDTDIFEFLNRNADMFADPENYLGGWMHDNNYYLDVSRVLQDRDEALRQAIAAGQLAIFDLNTFTEIPTGLRR